MYVGIIIAIYVMVNALDIFIFNILLYILVFFNKSFHIFPNVCEEKTVQTRHLY